jgi:hypothetical protein
MPHAIRAANPRYPVAHRFSGVVLVRQKVRLVRFWYVFAVPDSVRTMPIAL